MLPAIPQANPRQPQRKMGLLLFAVFKGTRGHILHKGSGRLYIALFERPEPVLYLPEESLPVKTPADRHDHLIRRVMQGMVMEHLPLP